MGNNQAGSDFEDLVIDFYNMDKLDVEALALIGKCFYGKYGDCDSGGWVYRETKDGKTVDQVVVEMVNPDYVVPVDEDGFPDYFDEFDRIVKHVWQRRKR